jgi:hypothetical protein
MNNEKERSHWSEAEHAGALVGDRREYHVGQIINGKVVQIKDTAHLWNWSRDLTDLSIFPKSHTKSCKYR